VFPLRGVVLMDEQPPTQRKRAERVSHVGEELHRIACSANKSVTIFDGLSATVECAVAERTHRMRRARSLLLLAVLALACGATAALPGVASAQSGIPFFGDFNNDGTVDEATVGPQGSGPCSVTLQLGNGDGTFGAPQSFFFAPPATAQGLCPNVGVALKVGDDTSPDIVASYDYVDVPLLVVLKNGTFQPAGTFHGAIEPDFLRTADFNGDGRQDLIEGSDQTTELETFLNNPDGTFTSGPIFACADHPQYALADFNGVGGQDMLLADNCPPSLVPLTAEVLFGNGQAPAVLFSTSNFLATLSVFPIDLNYDGIPDAGVVETASGVTTVMYFLNDGHAHFTPFTGDTAQGTTVTADLNNDGIPDQAALGQVDNSTTCTVTVRLGTAAGTFGKPRVHSYTTLERQQPFCPDLGVAVKLGRHRGPDLLTAFRFGFDDLVEVHRYQARTVLHGIIQPDWIRTADLNGDGRQDIIEGGNQEDTLSTFTNNKNGTLSPGPISVCAFQSGTGPEYVLADFNGDHGQDIFLGDNCPSAMGAPEQAVVLFGNGQAPVTLASSSDDTVRFHTFAPDVNYDGIPDAGVIETAGGVTTVRYFLNNGHGAFTSIGSMP
jgi:hypothetical protein